MLNKSREIKTTLFVETLDKIDSLKGAIANSKNRSAIIQQALEYWLKNSTVATEALALASQNTLDAALNLKNVMTEIADTDTKDQVSSSIDEPKRVIDYGRGASDCYAPIDELSYVDSDSTETNDGSTHARVRSWHNPAFRSGATPNTSSNAKNSEENKCLSEDTSVQTSRDPINIDELCGIEEGKVSVCVGATENEPRITQQECIRTDDEACNICDASLSGKSESAPSNATEATESEKKLDEPIARRSVRGLTIGL